MKTKRNGSWGAGLRAAVRSLSGGLILALALALAGCDFEHPNGAPTGAALDRRLLGTWKMVPANGQPSGPDKVVYLTLAEGPAARFQGNFGDLCDFDAYAIEFGGVEQKVPVLELRMTKMAGTAVAPGGGRPCYVFLFYQFEGERLTVYRLQPEKGVTLPDTEAQRRYLARMLADGKPHGSELHFERSTPAAMSGGAAGPPAAVVPGEPPPPAPTHAKPAAEKPAGAADSAPVFRFGPPPRFPSAMRQAGITGAATVEFVIDTDGRTTELRAVRATRPEFEAPALAAVAQWRFVPARKDGRPVKTRTSQTIEFKLE